MIDFDALVRAGGSFTPSGAAEWESYLTWCKDAPCMYCGRTKAETPKPWVTEIECGECFAKRATDPTPPATDSG